MLFSAISPALTTASTGDRRKSLWDKLLAAHTGAAARNYVAANAINATKLPVAAGSLCHSRHSRHSRHK